MRPHVPRPDDTRTQAWPQRTRRSPDRGQDTPSKLDETITIATWNIREFGKKPRHPASLHYIAEIIGRFDLVSVVELRADTTELETVLSYLGPYWRVVYSDYIADAGGNRERIAYVYDQRAVAFKGLASHAAVKRKKVNGEYLPEIGWWRPPYMASFASGDFNFLLLSAHIRWGEGGEAARVPELTLLADWIADRAKTDPGIRDIVVVGDFNIPTLKGPAYKAVTAKGLQMPKALAGVTGSNLARNKRYDQILHLPTFAGSFTGKGGVVDFYCDDFAALYRGLGVGKMSLAEFTFELSDHLPLWAQVGVDVDRAVRGDDVRTTQRNVKQ